MNQDEESSFPEFSLPKQPEIQKLIQLPPKQKSESEKRKELIQKLGKSRSEQKTSSKQRDEFTCFICQQYFVKPVTVKCGHSFCQFCLHEYFLFSKDCPICHKNIRESSTTYNNVLKEFTEGFIRSHHIQYWPFYEQKFQKYKAWRNQEKHLTSNFKPGMNVDIRDQNYVWCKGIVVRVISKVGDLIKFLKIQYKTQHLQTREQQLRWTNERLAPDGFYTERKEIPQYREQLKRQKKK